MMHSEWANRLMLSRDLGLWREYGTEAALEKVQSEWELFLLTRDARDLALVPQRIQKKAEELSEHEFGTGLHPRGGRAQEFYREHDRTVSPRERNAWENAFVTAYRERLDTLVNDLIPEELEPHLKSFCSLVSSVLNHVEGGGSQKDFGVSLGRKLRETPKIHPSTPHLERRARAEGVDEARMHWNWLMESGTLVRKPDWVLTPSDWELSPDEERRYKEIYSKSYMDEIQDRIKDAFSKSVLENAFLICSFYDELEAQKYAKRKDAPLRGWSFLRSSRRRDEWKLEDEWKAKYLPKEPSLGVAFPGQPLFSSPQVSITPGALEAFQRTGEVPADYLDRHFRGDFGDLDEHDIQMNLRSIPTKDRVLSAYHLSDGTRIYIQTDPDHETTVILLPSEY